VRRLGEIEGSHKKPQLYGYLVKGLIQGASWRDWGRRVRRDKLIGGKARKERGRGTGLNKSAFSGNREAKSDRRGETRDRDLGVRLLGGRILIPGRQREGRGEILARNGACRESC